MNPSPKMPDARSEVAAFTTLMTEFGNLLERETQALKAVEFASVDALQADKRQMARRYHDGAQTLLSMKEQIAALDVKSKESMIIARTKFTKILHDNMIAMEAVKSSAGRLVERIRSAMVDEVINERQTHYSSSGQVGSWQSAATSISLDSRL